MVSADTARRGLRFFLVGRVLSGLLGVVWLAVLVRALAREQLGLYYGLLSLFEIVQMASSVGVYSYAQRFLPADWVALPRRAFRFEVLKVLAWRLGTLLVAGALLGLVWRWVPGALAWPSVQPTLLVVLAFVLLEGFARFVDTLFECTMSQGVSQALSVLRNALRIGLVAAFVRTGAGLDAAWLLRMEAMLAGLYLMAALAWLARLVLRVPVDRAQPVASRQGRLAFAMQGYASLALGQLIGSDAVKLIVSHLVGPAVLAVLAFAQSMVDVVRRYMPAQLLLGFVRTLLTARAEAGGGPQQTLFWVRLLTRLNGLFLALACGWVLVFGDWALRAFTSRSGFGEAGPYLVVFMLMYLVGSLRLMATLVAQVQTRNRAVLEATASIVVGPAVAWAVVPVWGGAGAMLALALQELAYTGVLLWRLNLTLAQLCGAPGSWWRLAGATALAVLGGMVLRAQWPGHTGALVGSMAYGLLFALALWRLAPWDVEEFQALRRALLRRR